MARGPLLGALPETDGVRFRIWSGSAEAVHLCLFEEGGVTETRRIPLEREGDGFHSVRVDGLDTGARYGYRAEGPFAPQAGHWFDPTKLLVDPYAMEIDKPYVYDPQLAAPPDAGIDTAPLIPKAVVTALPPEIPPADPHFRQGGLIYELPVRAFTMRHPHVPEPLRGTVAALGLPVIIAHLRKIGVTAVELMPITAWIDERHLPPLGLTNAWGYNPVTFMALDPRLCPGGIKELRETVGRLHDAEIGVILDLVFNHTGESDIHGPTLSLRGLDAATYFRHLPDGGLVNDTGTGNTIACDRPMVRRMILDTLRHFTLRAGIDGFRFDLAPILGRSEEGFSPDAALFREMAEDSVLSSRVMIAEPWDIGPGGYQLGNFPDLFLEWNDRYRDRVRRFWRGDAQMLGNFASALAGSSDTFAGKTTRTVNFIVAHDGFSLVDLTAHADKHNEANGEANRDGHNENHSWNNGAEGETRDPEVLARRAADLRALLATLFVSRGSIMLTAGDEFGRTQHGNNNAYAQDNAITWLDWLNRDVALEDFVADLALLRGRSAALSDCRFLTGQAENGPRPDVVWLNVDGHEMSVDEWQQPEASALAMVLVEPDNDRIAVLFNRGTTELCFNLPPHDGYGWPLNGKIGVAARGVRIVQEARLAGTI